MIATVRGEVDGADLGFTLMHEHVVIHGHEFSHDYPDLAWQPDHDSALARVVERLAAVRAAGVTTVLDCTVFRHGRNLAFVQEVNSQVDINIVTCTGIFAFDNLPFEVLKRAVRSDDERDVLTEMFVRDITVGAGGTDIRSQVIKLCTDVEGVTPNNERILRAGARAHRETGRSITTHTQAKLRNGLDQQRVLRAEGVDLSRVVIGHCGDTTDLDYLRQLLDAGSVIGSDRFGMYRPGRPTLDERLDVIATLCDEGYADQIVISHDCVLHNDWVDYADPRDLPTPDWQMTHVPLAVVPALARHGVRAEHIDTMTIHTPRRILEGGDPY